MNDCAWYTIENAATPTIRIYGQIGGVFDEDVGADNFARDLEALGSPENITVRINSPGGSVFEGLAIYNTLKDFSSQITVIVDGLAASIASVIAMAGDIVRIPQTALMMIHDPSGLVAGTAVDMRRFADALDTVKQSLVAAYAEKTGMQAQEIAVLMEEETWMSADEAVDRGFADETDPSTEATARIHPGLVQGWGMWALAQKLTAADQPTHEHENEEIPVTDENHLTDSAVDETENAIRERETAAYERGLTEGAQQERDRIQAVESQLMAGHEDLINTLKFDGATTGPEAAVQVLNAEKQLRAQVSDSIAADEIAVAQLSDAAETQPTPADEAEKLWKKHANLQDVFVDFEDFRAYHRAGESLSGLI